MAQFFSHPGELSLDLTGDVVTENLDSMLASVSCGDYRLIKTLIENPTNGFEARLLGVSLPLC